MTRSIPFFSNLYNRFLVACLGLLLASVAFWTAPAHAQQVTFSESTCSTCVPPSTPIYGVTTWTFGQSAAAGQGLFKVIGTGDSTGSGAAGNTNELFNAQTLISFKADQACGPNCGDQVVQFKLDGLQQAMGASAAIMKGGTEGHALGQSGTALQSVYTAGGMFKPLTNAPAPAPTAAPTGN